MALIAFRGPDGRSSPDYYQRACKYAFTQSQRVVDGSLDVLYLLRDLAVNSIAKEFPKRMQTVVLMQRLMLTEKRKILGLVPDDADQGDYICILFRCSVPVVLREVKHVPTSTQDKGTHYEFVGECYVHGMMDGEAVEAVTAKDYQTFELR
jgi:hypothetical protein